MTRIRDGDTGPGGGKTNLKLNALHYNKIRLYMHEFRDLASRLVTALCPCHISRFNDLHRHRGVAHRASPCPTTILLRFVQHSVMWKEMAASKIFTYQGLTTCTEVDKQHRKGVFGGEEERGGERSGPGAARTILLVHITSARPSKQPLMVRTFLKVYMELGSYFLFLQKQIKDIIRHHHLSVMPSYL